MAHSNEVTVLAVRERSSHFEFDLSNGLTQNMERSRVLQSAFMRSIKAGDRVIWQSGKNRFPSHFFPVK